MHELWNGNIPNLSALKDHASVSGFVAIDAEPLGDSQTEITEIALPFIPIVDVTTLCYPPKSLKALQDRFAVQVYRIVVSGREQGNMKHRQKFDFGPTKCVEPEAVQDTLLELFDLFQATLGLDAPLILGGFDLVFEFSLISSSYLGIASRVSSWVDLQEIIRDNSSKPKFRPSMRDSLIAFGFDGDSQAVTSRRNAHNAGTDTLRVVALLVSLLSISPGIPMEIDQQPVAGWSPRRSADRHMVAKKQHSGRPKPRQSYPFRARVKVKGERGSALVSLRKLDDAFSKYGPTAVGIHGAKFEGYVCLPNLEELNWFIDQVDGPKAEAWGDEVWDATSEFDPQLTDARTASELSEFLAAQAVALIADKKSRRKQRKARNEAEDGSWDACLGGLEKLEV